LEEPGLLYQRIIETFISSTSICSKDDMQHRILRLANLRILQALFHKPAVDHTLSLGCVPLSGDGLVTSKTLPCSSMVTEPTLQRPEWFTKYCAFPILKKCTALSCIEGESEIALISPEGRSENAIGEIRTEFQHQAACHASLHCRSGFLHQRPTRPCTIGEANRTTAMWGWRKFGVEWMSQSFHS
jgi:hypothetical protein